MILKRNHHFWIEEDKLCCTTAQSFTELSTIALSILQRMPQPVGQVCGPISTGGAGSIARNLAIFDATIDRLITQGLTIFDQMPFEEHIFRIVESQAGARQNNQLLEEFYGPIFESQHVSSLYFIPGWESSAGAQWEHALGKSLGFEIVYLEPDLTSPNSVDHAASTTAS